MLLNPTGRKWLDFKKPVRTINGPVVICRSCHTVHYVTREVRKVICSCPVSTVVDWASVDKDWALEKVR